VSLTYLDYAELLANPFQEFALIGQVGPVPSFYLSEAVGFPCIARIDRLQCLRKRRVVMKEASDSFHLSQILSFHAVPIRHL